MMSRIRVYIVLLLSFCLTGVICHSETYGLDFPEHPEILSFESGTAPACADVGSFISISTLHYKLGEKSLLWEWERDGAALEILGEIPYMPFNPSPKETSISSFVFWIYSEAPIDGKVTVSFLKDGRECCRFEYGLDFSGWRGAWVAFDRDMVGTPEVGMDKVVFTAPHEVKRGRLFLDGIITSTFEDSRQHTAGFQSPYINPYTTSHWITLLQNWNARLDIPVGESLSETDTSDMQIIRDRFVTLVTEGRKILTDAEIGIKKFMTKKELLYTFKSYGIVENNDGTIRGKPIFFTRYGETYINNGISNASQLFASKGQLLVQANELLINLAVSWLNATDPLWKAEIERMYIAMTKHMLDQGYAAGSELGTLHHIGYSMRDFYAAHVIMRDVLAREGIIEEIQQTIEWFSGAGEMKTVPSTPGMDIDAFNTSLLGRTAALILMDDTPYKLTYFKALSRWIDNGFIYADGLGPTFKSDGTVQHHRKAYPRYAVGGFDGAVKAVWMLHGTQFSVTERSHNNLKRALLESRFFSNKKSFPMAMCGRFPPQLHSLLPYQFAMLAEAGSQEGTQEVDPDLASAFLRLVENSKEEDVWNWSDKFSEMGFSKEESPTGYRVYPFNCSMSCRQDDWLVTIAGHSRYLWSSEIYINQNLYGRYLTHGSMQILADGSPDTSNSGSGYRINGWDWSHIPGTTAAQIPMEDMRADVLNVDDSSGYEEMLLSDEWFAGGVSHRGKGGAFAMILHEHDKYNGSLRGHKSWFAFGNKIIALGSGLENRLPGSELHTTLFQNSLLDNEGFSLYDNNVVLQEYNGDTLLRDRFGNAWYVRDSKVIFSRGIQHSLHMETEEPCSGPFEKAYIYHGNTVPSNSLGNEYSKDTYEYMMLVHPTEDQVESCSISLPYNVLLCDNSAHIVRDSETGLIGAAFFKPFSTESGLEEVPIIKASPCILMCGFEREALVISVCNPDLNIYEGASDELYDKSGKRIERSVYSRAWIDDPCMPTSVEITLNGEWILDKSFIIRGGEKEENCDNDGKVTATPYNGETTIHISTREGRTEEIHLNRIF